MMKSENTLDNIRVDAAISKLFPDINLTRSKIQKMLEDGKIGVNS